MSETTKIAWADSTGSPWFGCTEVSPGCLHCYARELTLKHKWAGWGNTSARVRSKGFWSMAEKLNRIDWICATCGSRKPNLWDAKNGASCRDCGTANNFRRPRIFPSLMDWLDAYAPEELFTEFLSLIYRTPNLRWLLLTKRPELFESRLTAATDAWPHLPDFSLQDEEKTHAWLEGQSPENVWVGVTVEGPGQLDRIKELAKIPARIRFVSFEPLLEWIDPEIPVLEQATEGREPRTAVDWAIVGGESGPRRRDCGVEAICDLADTLSFTNGIPTFVKQDCARFPGTQGRIPDEVWKLKQFPHETLRSAVA